jgi:hypothetical protein
MRAVRSVRYRTKLGSQSAAPGHRFFAVGDPNQSNYGFTGARPELAAPFAARTDLTLTGNFRPCDKGYRGHDYDRPCVGTARARDEGLHHSLRAG